MPVLSYIRCPSETNTSFESFWPLPQHRKQYECLPKQVEIPEIPRRKTLKNFETCSSEQKSKITPEAKAITLNQIPLKKVGGDTGVVCTIFLNYTGVKLPLTEAKIINPLNFNIVEDTNILFCSAFTFSFITRELACKLDLSILGAKTHDQVVFGSRAPETKTFNKNIITMHHNGGRSHLILNETDYIIPDGISLVYNRKPDILIGADYF